MIKINSPRKGEGILPWAKEITNAVNSLQPTEGIGVSITQTQAGTRYSVAPSLKSIMPNIKSFPFDADYMLSAEGSETGSAFRIQRGDLYITYDHHTALIPPEQDLLVYDFPHEFDINNEGKWALCIKCIYEDGGEYDTVNTVLPINWGFEVADIKNGIGDFTSFTRLEKYPIAFIESKLTDLVDETWLKGPIKQTWVKGTKTFKMIQVYHGNIWFEEISGRQAVVAEIEQSGIGTDGSMHGNIIDDTGMYPETGIDIDAVELAGGTYYPTGARVIAHPIRVKILGGGYTE